LLNAELLAAQGFLKSRNQARQQSVQPVCR